MLHDAAVDVGLAPLEVERVFPGGISDILAFHSAEADRQMLEALPAEKLAALKVRERIALLVRTRLEQAEPHKEAIRRAVAHLALPTQLSTGAGSLWRTVDAMWLAAGDTATDFNFYTKRILLAKVYVATLYHWLEDESDEHQESWEFLERRIAEVLKAGKSLADAKTKLEAYGDRFVQFLAHRRAGAR